jgi:hypothetical protein
LANRLLAYRVALELQQRRGGRRGRDPSFRLAEVGERLLRCLVRHRAAGGSGDELAGWDDYQLASRAAVSVRQTRELYEEIGLGALVREALDLLEEQGLVSIARKSPSGPYQGAAPTESGRAAVNLDPWWRRLLSFFDPPPAERATP